MSALQNHPGNNNADSRLLKVVALVKQGDGQAFEELYRLTYKYVYFHAKSIMHDDDEAWDLVQETYIAVYQHIDSLREERYVKSWISGIVFNLGMKRFRKKRDLLLDEENDFLFDALEDETTDGSPEKAWDSKETAAIVQEVIDRLPALQKAAVIAYYFDEKSVADIAGEAMCSENTIKSRLNYARKAMKDAIEHKERQMGVKLHVVTGPMIVLVLRGMFSSMVVSGQKARNAWLGIRKALELAGMAAGGAGSAAAGTAGGGGSAAAAGSAGNAAAAGSAGSAAAAGSAGSAAAGTAGSAAAATSGAAAAAGAGASLKAGGALLFGAVKVKTAIIMLTASLAVGGAAGAVIGKKAIESGRQAAATEEDIEAGRPSAGESLPDAIPAETAAAPEDLSDGWKYLDDGRKYIKDGGYLRHTWEEIEGELYYFDRNGRMADRQISLGRQTFTFDKDGHITGIYAADNGSEGTVYCDEDIRYSLDSGHLIRTDGESGSQTIYDGPETLNRFTVVDSVAVCFPEDKILLLNTADGEILNEYILNGLLDSRIPASICLSDSALLLSTLGSGGTDGYLSEFTGLSVSLDGYHADPANNYQWEQVNYACGYSPEFYKLQAAGGEVYYLRSNRHPTASGVESSGYRLCRSSFYESTVLFDEDVDEFFINNDTLFYMTDGALKKKSLSQINAAAAERNQKALAAYREKLAEYAKQFEAADDTTEPSYPIGFSVIDLNQDGIFEVLVDRGDSTAFSYCELLYYTDHLEHADLALGCRTVNEENGLILSSIYHQDLECTVYHFDGTNVTQIASFDFYPSVPFYGSQQAANAALDQTLAELQRWEFGAKEIISTGFNEASFDLALSGDGARTGYIPSSLYQSMAEELRRLITE